jgi:hypothetical protein
MGDQVTDRGPVGAGAWIAVAAITLLGTLLRLVAVGSEPLWTDEALTYILAQAPAAALANAPIDPTAPLYYWLHQLLIPDGAGAAVGRSISVAAGVLTIPTVFLLSRGLMETRGALTAAGWVAVAFPLVDYSQEARAYALLVMLIAMSAMLLHRTIRSGGRWALTGFVVATLLALYTHFVALFWAGPAVLLLFAMRRVRKMRAADVIAIGFIPELWRMWRYTTEANAFVWLAQPGTTDFVRLLATQWTTLPWFGPALAALLALLAAAVVQRHRLAKWGRADPAGAAIIVILLLQPVALWLFGLALPVLMPRTMLFSALGVALLLGLLVSTTRDRLGWTIGSAVLVAALVTTLVAGPVREKEPWRGAGEALAAADPKLDLILACPYWQVPALMAATRGRSGAPLATPEAKFPRLVEERLGEAQGWERLLYRRAYESVYAPALGIAPAVMRRNVRNVRDLIVLTSECNESDIAAMRRWAGPHRTELLWSGAATQEHAGIRVERWQRGAVTPLELRVVP